MAFLSKVGNILRQSATKRISSEVSPFKVSAFQVIRCMSKMPRSKVYVGDTSYQTDEQSVREALAKYGQVVDAKIIMDHDTGRSRGFGFVTLAFNEEASSAIRALDGQDLHGRTVTTVRVMNYARDRRTGGHSGGGGCGSGFDTDGDRYSGCGGGYPQGGHYSGSGSNSGRRGGK